MVPTPLLLNKYKNQTIFHNKLIHKVEYVGGMGLSLRVDINSHYVSTLVLFSYNHLYNNNCYTAYHTHTINNSLIVCTEVVN